jgi:hypothetical protein
MDGWETAEAFTMTSSERKNAMMAVNIFHLAGSLFEKGMPVLHHSTIRSR